MRGCAFTGHRQIRPAHESLIEELLQRGVRYAYDRGCRDFFSGGALGFDTLAARAVLALRSEHSDVRLNLILPCPDQDEKWGYAARCEYQKILRLADSVEYASESYTKYCMHKRNRRLVELSDMIIAYYDLSGSGGTAYTVEFAKKAGREVHNLFPNLEKSAK